MAIDYDSPMTCPRRINEPGPWEYQQNLDSWNQLPNGDHVCSFCGSIHPAEFFNLLTVVVDPSTPQYLSMSNKPYKVYLKGRDISNAMVGAIKFYRQHETYPAMDNYELFLTEFNMALEASNVKMEAILAQHKAELAKRIGL